MTVCDLPGATDGGTAKSSREPSPARCARPGPEGPPANAPGPGAKDMGPGGAGASPAPSGPGDCRHNSSSQAVSCAALCDAVGADEAGDGGVAALNQSLLVAAGRAGASGAVPAAMEEAGEDAPVPAAPRRTRSCITERMRLGAESRLRTGHPALRQRSSSRASTRSSPLRPARPSRSRTVRSISSNPVSSRAKDANPAMPAESSSGRSAHLRTTHSPLPDWLSARRMSASSPLRARRMPAPGALTTLSPQAPPGRWEPGRVIPPARRR